MPTVSSIPWTPAERRLLARLRAPADVQAYLDTLAYSADPIYRAPASVVRDRKAHCFDGATFAAAALRRLGHRPLLVDLRAVRDDDHVVAVFARNGRWGAISKSNFSGLRFREPLFRSVRELVLSYFEFYFNTAGEKTLRAFSRPVDLAALDRLGWTHSDAALEVIARRLDAARHETLVDAAAARRLARVDSRTLAAGLLGSDPAGLYTLEPS